MAAILCQQDLVLQTSRTVPVARSFALLNFLRESEEGIYDFSLIVDFVEVCLIDEINEKTFLRPVSKAGADHSPDFVNESFLALLPLIVLENLFEDIVEIDLLRFQQVHFKHHFIPVD